VKEGQRLSFSLLLASALSVSAQLPGQAHSNILQGQPATVYRDPYGVPHIEAADERVAWFALGCGNTVPAAAPALAQTYYSSYNVPGWFYETLYYNPPP
jgi:hypothetical protein